jgi:hypothetical protein
MEKGCMRGRRKHYFRRGRRGKIGFTAFYYTLACFKGEYLYILRRETTMPPLKGGNISWRNWGKCILGEQDRKM